MGRILPDPAGDPLCPIGGASGYWGDAPGARAQLLAHDGLDFLVCDYLAEITLSILARARDPHAGYATDFVSAAMAPNLPTGELTLEITPDSADP